MSGPAWLEDTLAALMLAISVYCVGRLAISRVWRRATEHDADSAHVVMGVAMAGMLVPQLNPLWNSTGNGAWEAVFGVTTAWFGWRLLRTARAPGAHYGVSHAHHGPHLVHSVAMLYMLLAIRTSGSSAPAAAAMGGMGTGGTATRFPVLALVLALALFGYAVLDVDRLGGLAATSQDGRPLLAPRLAGGCRIALGLTMSYMLIVML
jgi:hypothetical protein